MTRFVSVALLASFLVGTFPGLTYADESGIGPSAPSVNFRAAIDRATAVQHMPAYLSIAPRDTATAAKARQGSMGGGGGKGVLIWTLVGTAASLATTYYVIKEVRKQTDAIAQQ